MKILRGSTSSPISRENQRSAAAASSTSTRMSIRRAGSIVVAHSSGAFISLRPLNRVIEIPLFAKVSAPSRRSSKVSASWLCFPSFNEKGGRPPTMSASRA
jgi:hypothetical protein